MASVRTPNRKTTGAAYRFRIPEGVCAGNQENARILIGVEMTSRVNRGFQQAVLDGIFHIRMKLVDGRTIVNRYRLGSGNFPFPSSCVWIGARETDRWRDDAGLEYEEKRGTDPVTSRENPTFVVGQISEKKSPKVDGKWNHATDLVGPVGPV